MKICKRILSIVLVAILAVSMVGTITSSAATPDAVTISNTTKENDKELTSGVRYTKYEAAAGTYHGSNAIQFDVVEIDMSTQNLYIDNVYAGSNAYSQATAKNIINNFNNANSSLTPIAAINADLWWIHSSITEPDNGGKALLRDGSKILNMSLGFSMSNGEIYTSDRMLQENFASPTGAAGYEDYVSFGITSDHVPVISNPNAQVIIKNTTKGTSAVADGINRLPANNALVMYTDRACANNYANDDAYEVKIKITSTSDYKIAHGTKISGKVEGVFAPGGSNPTMSSNCIILTARGNRADLIKNYKAGDTVEISTSIYDQSGKYTAQWQKVTDAISGHFPFVQDGTSSSNVAAGEGYPATFIGITKDNNVVMFTQGSTDGSRSGIQIPKYAKLGKELNLKDCFMLDGGGSSCLYVLDNGEYKLQSSPYYTGRSLMNMLVLSTGPKRAAQGTVATAAKKSASGASLDFSNSANIGYVTGEKNDTVMTSENSALKLTSAYGKDPYVTFDYSLSRNAIQTTKYKYLTIEYMLPTANKKASYDGEINYVAGTNSTPKKGSMKVSGLIRDGKYHKVILDFNTLGAKWSGSLQELRFDYFNNPSAGDTMYIKSVVFSATKPVESPVNSATTAPTATAAPNKTSAPATAKPTSGGNKTVSPVKTPTQSEVVAPSETAVVTTDDIVTTEGTEADVTEAPDDTEDDGDEKKKSDPTSMIIIICCAAVVVVVGGLLALYFFVIRKKK